MNLPITPETKVGALLEAYPAVEDRLIEWVPAFARLKNPILRKTVAKVATLEQAARVGGVGVRELVRKLREATGQPDLEILADGAPEDAAPPAWLREDRVCFEIDADAMLSGGVHPIGKVRQCAAELAPGEMVRLSSGFRPVPLIETMRRGGFAVYSAEIEPGKHTTYICREA